MTASSPSSCTTTLPGRGADSDQPSQPASTSCAFVGRVRRAVGRCVSDGALQEAGVRLLVSTSPRALDLDVEPARCSECQSPLTSSQTSRRTPRLSRPRCAAARSVPASSAASLAAAPSSRSCSCSRPVDAGEGEAGGAQAWRAPTSPGRRCSPAPTCAAACRTYCSSLSAEASGSRSSTV